MTPAHGHRDIFTLSVLFRPIYSASAASLTAVSKFFCATRAGLFLLERARAPHAGRPWPFVETPARRSSDSWLIHQSCPTGAFSNTLPASPSRAARGGCGPWVMFLVSRHGRRLVLYLGGAPSSNGERKQATKGGALFWMGIPDCSHVGQVRPDWGNVGFLL